MFLFIGLASQAQEVYVVADPNIVDANFTNKLPTGYSLKWVSSTKTDNPENTVYIMLTEDYDIRADLEKFVNQGKKVYLIPEGYTPPIDAEVTDLSIPSTVVPEIDPPHIPPRANRDASNIQLNLNLTPETGLLHRGLAFLRELFDFSFLKPQLSQL